MAKKLKENSENKIENVNLNKQDEQGLEMFPELVKESKNTNNLTIVGEWPASNFSQTCSIPENFQKAFESIKLEYKPVESLNITDEYRKKIQEREKINWFQLLDDDQIFINQSYKAEVEKKYGKTIGELNPRDLDEKFILISLAGLKSLASLKGYKSIRYPIFNANENFAFSVCEIIWNDGNIVSGAADARPENTGTPPFCYFLSALCENRSLGRAIRTSLGISALCKEELSSTPLNNKANEEQISQLDPRFTLRKKIDSLNYSFDKFKNWWQKEYGKEHGMIDEGAATWTDINQSLTFKILGVLRQREEEKSKKV